MRRGAERAYTRSTVLARFRRLGAGRIGALLAALLLSGAAPPLVGALADEPEHRCHCRHAPGERCSCPRCRAASADARRARLAAAPPCHRAVVAAEIEREERDPAAGATAMHGCCGDDAVRVALQRGDPFVPAPAGVPGGPAPAEPRLRARSEAPRDLARAPPVPPPRRA